MKPPKVTYAVLDVSEGRAELLDHFAARPRLGPCPRKMRLPFYAVGFMDGLVLDDEGAITGVGAVVSHLALTAPKATGWGDYERLLDDTFRAFHDCGQGDVAIVVKALRDQFRKCLKENVNGH